MPELPEVETIVTSLKPLIEGKTISKIAILSDSIIRDDKKIFCKKLLKKTITEVSRCGKFIVIKLENLLQLAVHLRMTGKFIYPSQGEGKHDRIYFDFSDKTRLIYSDIRNFGTMELLESNQSIQKLKNLGFDAIDKKILFKDFYNLLQIKKVAIKNFLLDQTKIAGIGNIYAAEILFDSKISPFKICEQVTKTQAKRLLKSTQAILNLAIKHNGTSISDYRRVDDKKGEFQNFLKVYGKKGNFCCRCSSLIQKIKQKQRSTFFCAKCQKN